jgi:predicted Rossmann fold nucleotide-binding protein DprA/Smf involved in DNA uptake
LKKILPKDPHFSNEQAWELSSSSISEIWAIGNTDLLQTKKLGLLCSVRCPAKIVLKTTDYMRTIAGKYTIVSGFHSPVEKECLRILLREIQPVVICPARSIDTFTIPKLWEKPLEEEKLLILSMFKKSYDRFNARLAYQRNKFVVILADKVLIPFADKRSKTIELTRFLVSKGKTVLTFDVPENQSLLQLGAKTL